LEALLAAALRNRDTDTIANTETRGQRSSYHSRESLVNQQLIPRL
jgi:hypothetical protein